jgi:LacI family transcriptional regulator
VPDHRILSSSPTLESGYENAFNLLSQNPEITAIFAYNDLVALGVFRACKQLGRRVPEDCAVIGFDDIQLASLVDPPLTTVRLDKYSIGQLGMQRLLEMLDNPDTRFPPIDLGVEFIRRESA